MKFGLPDVPQNLESPIEERFYTIAYMFLKCGLEPELETSLTPQSKIKTRLGTFRVDFVAEHNGRKIGIECDGKDFHTDWLKDLCRDAAILSSGEIEGIYRFSGAAITHYAIDCMRFITNFHRKLFPHATPTMKWPPPGEYVSVSLSEEKDGHIAKVIYPKAYELEVQMRERFVEGWDENSGEHKFDYKRDMVQVMAPDGSGTFEMEFMLRQLSPGAVLLGRIAEMAKNYGGRFDGFVADVKSVAAKIGAVRT